MDEQIRRSQLKISIYLFLGALAVRLLYLSQYAGSPFFWVPSLDALYHDLHAQAIAAGHSDLPAFFRAPLYYYCLGGVYWLFGHSFWAARAAQAGMGAASCVLLFRLGARVFRPTIGLLAAVAMALYGPLVFFDGELLTSVLEVFLDLWFLLLAVQALESGSRRHWIGAGLVLGLSAITRPNILVAALLALLCLALSASREGHGRKAGAAALFLAACALAPGLVTLRNYRVSGDPVFIASQGGINLYLGNRPGADGFTPSTPTRYRFTGPYEDSVALYGQRAAEVALHRPLAPSEAQAYWVRQVIRWWREHPVDALKLTARKCVLAWSHQEIRNNHAFAFVRAEFAPLLWCCPFGFWLAGPLGLLGMGLAWRATSGGRRQREVQARGQWDVRFLALFILVYTASYVPFFIADRYRLPIIPPLLLFGAYAAVSLAENARGRNWRRLAPAVVALAAGVLFVNCDWCRTATPATWALDYWSAGNGYAQLGRLPEAEGMHRKAVALDPGNAELWTNLGADQFAEGHFKEAAVSFQRSIALAPQDGTPYYDLAQCARQQRQPELARRCLEAAVRVDPEYERARVELAEMGAVVRSP